jgi:hypothetical protein
MSDVDQTQRTLWSVKARCSSIQPPSNTSSQANHFSDFCFSPDSDSQAPWTSMGGLELQ